MEFITYRLAADDSDILRQLAVDGLGNVLEFLVTVKVEYLTKGMNTLVGSAGSGDLDTVLTQSAQRSFYFCLNGILIRLFLPALIGGSVIAYNCFISHTVPRTARKIIPASNKLAMIITA